MTSDRTEFSLSQELGMDAALLSSDPHGLFRAAGRLSHHLYGHPCRSMRVVAVTGTNGKTTVAWLLRQALHHLEGRAGSIGTLGVHNGESMEEIGNTTPFPVEAAEHLAALRDAGCRSVVMEASSHALHQERLAGCTFDAGVFTNLTQDHLDYHKTMGNYAEAKKRLFTDWAAWSREEGKDFASVINADDPWGAEWLPSLAGRVLSYGRSGQVAVVPEECTASRIALQVRLGEAAARWQAPLGGSFNLENLAAAGACLCALGWSAEDVAEALGVCLPVPGRFEPVPNEKGIDVVVDYAHTPDALEKLLESCRAVARGKIITVFGCGGNRDRTKRPLMARAASLHSDLCVLTSDNPREEDPLAILADVEPGIVAGKESRTVVDRREAVAWAIGQAREGDMVVLAGKGHENYQIIGKVKHPMDDRELAREALGA